MENIVEYSQNQTPPAAAALKAQFDAFSHELDLTAVKFKLMAEHQWPRERADKVEREYKAFLFLVTHDGGTMLVPTPDIDQMWHSHILDTRKYMADCARLFREYIHHYPYLGMQDAADALRAEKLFAATAQKMSALGIKVGYAMADCGGGCGGGCGHGCGGGDSGGGHGGDSGGGHGGHSGDTPASDNGTFGIIPGCSSSDRDNLRKKTPRTPSRQPDRPESGKKGILRRILGLAPTNGDARWYASVTPELFPQKEYRPDQLQLDKEPPKKSTLH